MLDEEAVRPSQGQLVLPLLEALDAQGGRARSKTLCDAVAERVGLPAEDRAKRGVVGAAGSINLFDRNVRWAQQRAKLLGLAEPIGNGHWRITGKGRSALKEAAPGVVVTVFVTGNGVALFGRCEDAVGYLDDGSVQLLLTSPPYPLLREKQYGNVSAAQYVDWFLRIAEAWSRKLTTDGSIALNLMDVWTPGRPALSLYQERLLVKLEESLGLKLQQRFFWNNPSKLPAPAEWVTVRRVRVKPTVEQVYWLSPHEHPHADNRQVLLPYSESMKKRIAQGGERGALRPSGHQLAPGAFNADHGGAIPGTLITAANTESNSDYVQQCKAAGLPVHPARFPAALAEFFIRLLTRAGDLIFDPFGGSGTTGAVAERLGRFWVTSETVLDYVQGMKLRFPNAL